MLYFNFTEKLLGLEEVIVKNTTQTEKCTFIDMELKRKSHNCPCCGTATGTVKYFAQISLQL
jgi:transposase